MDTNASFKYSTVAVLLLISVVAMIMPFRAKAVDVLYDEVSNPPGLHSNSRIVASESVVNSSAAPFSTDGYSFAEWQLGGVRQQDMLGRALNPFSFTIYEPTTVTAVYLASSDDTDSDAIPDWFEWEFYGDLNETAASDTDGDGISLLSEYSRDHHPNLSNEVTGRGISWQRSDVVFVQLTVDPLYTEKTQPEGLVSEIQQTLVSGSTVTTRALYGTRNDHTFAHWLVNGERQSDLVGRAVDPVAITITEDTDAVAVHVASAQDNDANGLPDWYELNFFGANDQLVTSDSDGDSIDLLTEYERDYHPAIYNEVTGRGLSWQRSDLLTVISSSNYVVYTEKTDPEGLVSAIEQGLLIGAERITRSMAGSRGGHQFTHWTLSGVRQGDLLGQALDPVEVTITGTTEAVALHMPESQDIDLDGIPDWYEVRFGGSTNLTAASDVDGDGVDLATEYAKDYNPNILNEITGRGLAWQRSEVTYVDLQMFERVKYVMTNGVLRGWFSRDPLEFEGSDLGSNTAPAAGDWDGDGDPDVFVGMSDGTMRIFENQGSRYTMNIWECTDAFKQLVSGQGTMTNVYPSLGDWNGDGAADLAIGGESGLIRIVSSTKKFLPSQHPAVDYDFSVTGSSTAIPAFAEITGDALLDLLVLLDDGTVRVYPNTGNSSTPFSSTSHMDDLLETPVPNGSGLSAADVNYDGYTDVLISGNDGRIWNFHGSAGGTFTLNSKVWAGAGNGFAERLTLSVADLDGDNDMDALCGYAEGGLMYLRDPRIGIPAGLRAAGGAGSVQLDWDPNRSHRLKGYFVYRALGEAEEFVNLTPGRFPQNSYLDSDASAGVLWHYYVTAVSEAYYPGNTVAKEVESRPSETVMADTGRVVLWMPDYFGKTGETAVLQVNVEHGTGIIGSGLDLRITYDASLLTPLSQVSTNPTVSTTALTEALVVTNNATLAVGELQITGSGGTVVGDGHLFNIHFQVAPGAPAGQTATNVFAQATLYGEGNILLNVDSSDTAQFAVTASGYFRGDINGDGVLDMDDHHHLMWLLKKKTRDPIPEELSAGDMNGDGELTHKDISLHLQLIHGHETE